MYLDFVTQFSFEIGGSANNRYCLMIFGPFFQIIIKPCISCRLKEPLQQCAYDFFLIGRELEKALPLVCFY
ncbi:MAG: hypothetical protein ACI8PB_002431 [Desulforhopalus sp.]|jgi:hypothetical protein